MSITTPENTRLAGRKQGVAGASAVRAASGIASQQASLLSSNSQSRRDIASPGTALKHHPALKLGTVTDNSTTSYSQSYSKQRQKTGLAVNRNSVK